MRLRREDGNSSPESQIMVIVDNIGKDTIECYHAASQLKIKAFYKPEMTLTVGQVVLIEYNASKTSSGYIVVDDLTSEIRAKVIASQHIIDNKNVYIDLIIKNLANGSRVHLLVDNSNKLFCKTDTLIIGDIINIKLNNGVIFDVEILDNDEVEDEHNT